jgi:4-hydroxyphenylacetate 3-hydroxylase N terminal
MSDELETSGTVQRPRLRSADEYRESLRDGRRVFYRGVAVEDVTAHPVFSLAVNHAALDFEMAHDEAYAGVAVGPDGYSRYFHLPQIRWAARSRPATRQSRRRDPHGSPAVRTRTPPGASEWSRCASAADRFAAVGECCAA